MITDKELIIRMAALLQLAVCPDCDGSGVILIQTSRSQVVTREMAMDAGTPEMEGGLYYGDDTEQQECRWCDEKKKLIKEYKKNYE